MNFQNVSPTPTFTSLKARAPDQWEWNYDMLIFYDICYNHKMQILLPKHGDVPSDPAQPAGDVDSPSLPAGTHLCPNERGGDSGGGVGDGVDDDDVVVTLMIARVILVVMMLVIDMMLAVMMMIEMEMISLMRTTQ